MADSKRRAGGAPAPRDDGDGSGLGEIQIPEALAGPSLSALEAEDLEAHRALGQILKEMRLVTESQIQEAIAIQRQRGGALDCFARQ